MKALAMAMIAASLATLTMMSGTADANSVYEVYEAYGTSASLELYGSRSVQRIGDLPGGLILVEAQSKWTDARIDWEILPHATYWSYKYTFTDFYPKDISNIVIDITDKVIGPGGFVDSGAITDAMIEYTDDDDNTVKCYPVPEPVTETDNSGIVGAVKFDFPSYKDGDEEITGSPVYLYFNSTRNPVYGNIHIKGGEVPQEELKVLLANAGWALFQDDPVVYDFELHPEWSDRNNFIARPDGSLGGEPPMIPEPVTVLGVLLGVGGLGGYLARRRNAA